MWLSLDGSDAPHGRDQIGRAHLVEKCKYSYPKQKTRLRVQSGATKSLLFWVELDPGKKGDKTPKSSIDVSCMVLSQDNIRTVRIVEITPQAIGRVVILFLGHDENAIFTGMQNHELKRPFLHDTRHLVPVADILPFAAIKKMVANGSLNGLNNKRSFGRHECPFVDVTELDQGIQ